MEIRRSLVRLISTIGFHILVRWHLHIESGPGRENKGNINVICSHITKSPRLKHASMIHHCRYNSTSKLYLNFIPWITALHSWFRNANVHTQGHLTGLRWMYNDNMVLTTWMNLATTGDCWNAWDWIRNLTYFKLTSRQQHPYQSPKLLWLSMIAY